MQRASSYLECGYVMLKTHIWVLEVIAFVRSWLGVCSPDTCGGVAQEDQEPGEESRSCSSGLEKFNTAGELILYIIVLVVLRGV